MRQIFEINELARRCGYFFNACLSEEDFHYNNGYNCRHPDQEEQELNERTGNFIGGCFGWSCPLGYEAGEEDFESPEIDSRGFEYEENNFVVVEEGALYDNRSDC